LYKTRELDGLTAREGGCNLTLGVEMGSSRPDLVVISTVKGELIANVVKSHLESEGIPVLLEYEADPIRSRYASPSLDPAGIIVRILVPQELAEEARQIIEPGEPRQTEE
jgi:hypothetical protein